MSTTTDDVTIDIEAIDAAAAKKADDKAKTASEDSVVVVDPEISTRTDDNQGLTPDAALKKLSKQLEDERAARLAAESRANEAAQNEAKARTESQSSQLDLVKSAIASVTQSSDGLEVQYADAMAAQDWAGAAKAQRAMATNAAKLSDLERGKVQLERAPKPEVRQPVDLVEKWISNIGPEYPRSKDWVRAHPEFVLDKSKEADMVAAHRIAVRQGFKPESDRYFRSIEMSLGIPSPGASTDEPRQSGKTPTIEEDPTADVAATTAAGGRQIAPAAAPVTRSGNGAAGSPRSTRMTLTAEQAEMARASFPESKTPLEDYARQIVALRKEGKMS